MRGLRKVAEECLLAAAAQNIKKIAMLRRRRKRRGLRSRRGALERALARLCRSGWIALNLTLPAYA